MSRTYVKWALVLAIIVVLAFAVPAVAKQGGGGTPGGGGGIPGGGGGGGNKPPSELSNNLSVPLIMITGSSLTGVAPGASSLTPSALQYPANPPLTGYEIDPAAYYYVQRVHTWQAQSFYADTAIGKADWGDNLTGDASLKAGSPIRVELGLFDDTGVTLDGFWVDKLEPSKLDRESAYGTLATMDNSGVFSATATNFPATVNGVTRGVRIYDQGVTFSIQNLDSGTYVVQPGSNPTGEINAGGAVVYGYNLRVAVAGTYRITFEIPAVTITAQDGGAAGGFDADTVWLDITVVSGGGGGGGGGKPQ